jgi:hypothetical protein
MWNVIVSEDLVALIDWDLPIVCDPALFCSRVARPKGLEPLPPRFVVK